MRKIVVKNSDVMYLKSFDALMGTIKFVNRAILLV